MCLPTQVPTNFKKIAIFERYMVTSKGIVFIRKCHKNRSWSEKDNHRVTKRLLTHFTEGHGAAPKGSFRKLMRGAGLLVVYNPQNSSAQFRRVSSLAEGRT